MQLRPFQAEEKRKIYAAWDSGVTNVLEVLPTGAGKTVLFSNIIKETVGAKVAIAHRQELVTQISLALARNGVPHRIIGPKPVIKLAVSLHMDELGQSFYNPLAVCAVAGVDTLVRRKEELQGWLNSVKLWVMDEAHHTLVENKWGTAVRMFPNAKGLGVTATPLRADYKGLGVDSDGVFEEIIVGPSMRDLINMEYLTEYRIFAPPTQIDLSEVNVTNTGELNQKKMVAAVRKSQIVGDVVAHYKRIANGKLGVTFASDVQTATDIANRFNKAGIPAAVVSAKTPDAERIRILRAFKNRELLQLVNVDLFGEGFDLPAIEVVSMARPTESFALYAQQFGRALRIMDGKFEAIIIDHVGNVERHGLPDAPRTWSLGARSRTRGGQGIPLRTCMNMECFEVYERVLPKCPHCGEVPEIADIARSSPELVEGDLVELDPATLAEMRGEVEKVDMPAAEYRAQLAARNVPAIGQMANVNRHLDRQEMQAGLRASIAWWAGYYRAQGQSDSEIYKRFFYTFRTDILSAQALKTKDALVLGEAINSKIGALEW